MDKDKKQNEFNLNIDYNSDFLKDYNNLKPDWLPEGYEITNNNPFGSIQPSQGFSLSAGIDALGDAATTVYNEYLTDPNETFSDEVSDTFSWDKFRQRTDEAMDKYKGNYDWTAEGASNLFYDTALGLSSIVGGAFDDIISDPLDLVTPDIVSQPLQKGLEAGAKVAINEYKGSELEKKINSLSPTSKNMLAGTALFGSTIFDVLTAGEGKLVRGSVEEAIANAVDAKDIYKILQKEKQLGLSSAETQYFANQLKDIMDPDEVGGFLHQKMIDNIIFKENGKKFKKHTTELEQFNDRIANTYKAIYQGVKKDKVPTNKEIFEEFDLKTAPYQNIDKITDNKHYQISHTIPEDDFHKLVLGKTKKALENYDKLAPEVKADIIKLSKKEFADKYTKDLKLSVNELGDIYRAKKFELEKLTHNLDDEKAILETIKKQRKEVLSEKEIARIEKRKEMIKQDYIRQAKARDVDIKFSPKITPEVFEKAGVSADVNSKFLLNSIKQDIKSTGFKGTQKELSEQIKNKIAILNDRIEKQISTFIGDENIADDINSIDFASKTKERLYNTIAKDDKIGQAIIDNYIVDGKPLKDIYAISKFKGANGDIYKFTWTKEEYNKQLNALQDNLKLYSKEMTPEERANYRRTLFDKMETFGQVVKGSYYDFIASPAVMFEKFGLGWVFKTIKKGDNDYYVAHNEWLQRWKKEGIVKENVEGKVHFNLSKKEASQLQKYINSSQNGLEKGDTLYIDWDELNPQQQKIYNAIRKEFEKKTPDFFSELGRTNPKVGFIEDYMPTAGNKDLLEKVKKTSAWNAKKHGYLDVYDGTMKKYNFSGNVYEKMYNKHTKGRRKDKEVVQWLSDDLNGIVLGAIDSMHKTIHTTNGRIVANSVLYDKQFVEAIDTAWGNGTMKKLQEAIEDYVSPKPAKNIEKTLAYANKLTTYKMIGLSVKTILKQPLSMIIAAANGDLDFTTSFGKVVKELEKKGITKEDLELASIIKRTNLDIMLDIETNKYLDKLVSATMKPAQMMDKANAGLTAKRVFVKEYKDYVAKYGDVDKQAVEEILYRVNKKIDLIFAGSSELDKSKFFRNKMLASLGKFMYPTISQSNYMIYQILKKKTVGGKMLATPKVIAGLTAVVYAEEMINTLSLNPYEFEDDPKTAIVKSALGATLPFLNNIFYAQEAVEKGRVMQLDWMPAAKTIKGGLETAFKVGMLFNDDVTEKEKTQIFESIQDVLLPNQLKKIFDANDIMVQDGMVEIKNGVRYIINDPIEVTRLYLGSKYSTMEGREYLEKSYKEQKNAAAEKEGRDLPYPNLKYTSKVVEAGILASKSDAKSKKRLAKAYISADEKTRNMIELIASLKKDRVTDTVVVDTETTKYKNLFKGIASNIDDKNFKELEEKIIKPEFINVSKKTNDEVKATLRYVEWLREDKSRAALVKSDKLKQLKKWALSAAIYDNKLRLSDEEIKKALHSFGYKKVNSKDISEVMYHTILYRDKGYSKTLQNLKKWYNTNKDKKVLTQYDREYIKTALDKISKEYGKRITEDHIAPQFVGWVKKIDEKNTFDKVQKLVASGRIKEAVDYFNQQNDDFKKKHKQQLEALIR